MANQKQKKQALLGSVQAKKGLQQPTNKRLTPQQLQMQQQLLKQRQLMQQQGLQDEPKKPSLKKWITLVVILVIAVLFPKPQLIAYEKLGMVAESVYWPGLPGIDPVLFDSNLHPRPALERNTLYLCIDKNNPDSCQKYQIVAKQGFVAAVKKLISD
jgi:hypothetical protein